MPIYFNAILQVILFFWGKSISYNHAAQDL